MVISNLSALWKHAWLVFSLCNKKTFLQGGINTGEIVTRNPPWNSSRTLPWIAIYVLLLLNAEHQAFGVDLRSCRLDRQQEEHITPECHPVFFSPMPSWYTYGRDAKWKVTQGRPSLRYVRLLPGIQNEQSNSFGFLSLTQHIEIRKTNTLHEYNTKSEECFLLPVPSCGKEKLCCLDSHLDDALAESKIKSSADIRKELCGT